VRNAESYRAQVRAHTDRTDVAPDAGTATPLNWNPDEAFEVAAAAPGTADAPDATDA
jgi:hypothetical protein